jgi:hypothetical protein
MAFITVKDLVKCPISGADLFNDSESFMRDLSEDELYISGGCPRTATRCIPTHTGLF